MDDIQQYYQNRDNCLREIKLARDVFTSQASTVEQWAATHKALGLMFLYCPVTIQYMVEATLDEMQKRAALLGILADLLEVDLPGE